MLSKNILVYLMKAMKFQIPPIMIQTAIILSCLMNYSSYKINRDRYLNELHQPNNAIEIQTIEGCSNEQQNYPEFANTNHSLSSNSINNNDANP